MNSHNDIPRGLTVFWKFSKKRRYSLFKGFKIEELESPFVGCSQAIVNSFPDSGVWDWDCGLKLQVKPLPEPSANSAHKICGCASKNFKRGSRLARRTLTAVGNVQRANKSIRPAAWLSTSPAECQWISEFGIRNANQFMTFEFMSAVCNKTERSFTFWGFLLNW